MKFIKTLSATAVAVALTASMAVSASATTYKDAVQAAKDAGVQDINVQELENFLEANADYFTSDEYDYMISVINDVRDTYVAPKAMEMFGKTPGELTEDEKWELGQTWSKDDRAAIKSTLVELGDKYDVEVDIDKLTKGDYEVEASIKRDSSRLDSNNSSTDSGTSSNTGTGTQTVVTNPVANTGANVSAAGVDSGAVAGAGLALILAATGVVVVCKKNKS